MKYLIILITCLSLQQVMAQQSPTVTASTTSPTASTPSTENWGKITGEKNAKSYTTRDGKITYTIGGTIQIGMGSAEDKSFQYIKAHISANKFVKTLLASDVATLDKEYEDTKFTITNIYEGFSNNSDILVKDAPKTVFIVIETATKAKWDVAIEKALKTKEVESN